jgi:chromosome segregation ATPase
MTTWRHRLRKKLGCFTESVREKFDAGLRNLYEDEDMKNETIESLQAKVDELNLALDKISTTLHGALDKLEEALTFLKDKNVKPGEPPSEEHTESLKTVLEEAKEAIQTAESEAEGAVDEGAVDEEEPDKGD